MGRSVGAEAECGGGSGRVEVLWHGRVSESEVEETKAVMGQEM